MLNVQVEYWKLQETKRHNIETEKWNTASLNETQRHNLIVEGQSERNLEETVRHNQATEAYNYANLAEMHRSNIANENIARYNAEIANYNANTNRLNADINQINAANKSLETYANIKNTQIKESLAPSEKFKNIATGLGGFINGAVSLVKASAYEGN